MLRSSWSWSWRPPNTGRMWGPTGQRWTPPRPTWTRPSRSWEQSRAWWDTLSYWGSQVLYYLSRVKVRKLKWNNWRTKLIICRELSKFNYYVSQLLPYINLSDREKWFSSSTSENFLFEIKVSQSDLVLLSHKKPNQELTYFLAVSYTVRWCDVSHAFWHSTLSKNISNLPNFICFENPFQERELGYFLKGPELDLY